MKHQLTRFLSHYNIPRNTNFLLAVSGGLDSVVLAHLMHTQGFPISIAHFNYQLRGEESNLDELFVKELAESWGVPFLVNTADTKSLAISRRKGVQEVARNLRYIWFQRLVKTQGFEWIVTAHHLNDSIETTLLNLTKGTGLRGLRGILPVNQNIIRPLINTTKDEIKQYAEENNLTWQHDASNDQTDYQRNFIRHKVVPQLKKINPSLENTFKINFKHAQGYLGAIKHYMKEYGPFCATVDDNLVINGTEILKFQSPETILFELIRKFGFNLKQIIGIIRAIPGTEEAVFYSKSFQILVKDSMITIIEEKKATAISTALTEVPSSIQAGDHLITVERLEERPVDLDAGPQVAYFDESTVQFPLIIRNWKEGDRFQPFGMDGKTKKLSDCFTDWKYNSIQKNKQLILESNGQICWVIGKRIDHRFAVGQGTGQVLKLTVSV